MTRIFLPVFFSLLIISSMQMIAQDSTLAIKKDSAKTIWDIPHKTGWEKWMWIHRSVAFEITKERKVNYDTAFIKSFYKRLVITLPVSTRFLQFSLIDSKNGKKLTFAPNLEYDLGISVSSRWASFILNSGVKIFNEDTKAKGKTRYQDYQLNLYGRKITTDMFFQYYNGFYIKNSKSYDSYTGDKPFSVRADVYCINMGVSTYYIVNNKRFSYGNSFAFVEQQKKSAGSVLLGIYYSYFEANGTPSLVNEPFRTTFDSLLFIHAGHTHNFGMNLGYIYTLVFFKKCHATAALVQGVGLEQVSYKRDNTSTYNQLVGGAGKLNVRLSLGYDNGRYFIGTMGMFDYFSFRKKSDSTFDYSFGKFMAYIGYRFSVLKVEQKLLNRLKLIDY
jgi:hypothetical protein